MVFEQSWWGNRHKCMQNEVWKVWLQKEFILIGYWLSQVGGKGFLCLGNKIGEKVKSWFLSNLFWGIVTNTSKKRCQKFGCKRNWSWLSFDLAKLGGFVFYVLVAKFVKTVFEQSWSGIVTNASKMTSQKFGCKRNWSWLGFGLAMLGGFAFCALVAKRMHKWSHGFWAILVGNSHKSMQNQVWKVWLQKELILVGFWLSQVGWIGVFDLVEKLVNKWSNGFLAALVRNCQKCIQNEVSKFGCKRNSSWLSFGLAKLGGLAFFTWWKNWWISEVMVFEQPWWGIVKNASKMRCQNLVAKGIHRGWVLA